jgi:hypothetical protein
MDEHKDGLTKHCKVRVSSSCLCLAPVPALAPLEIDQCDSASLVAPCSAAYTLVVRRDGQGYMKHGTPVVHSAEDQKQQTSKCTLWSQTDSASQWLYDTFAMPWFLFCGEQIMRCL